MVPAVHSQSTFDKHKFATHSISRLVVPLRSGNSFISFAPFSDLELTVKTHYFLHALLKRKKSDITLQIAIIAPSQQLIILSHPCV